MADVTREVRELRESIAVLEAEIRNLGGGFSYGAKTSDDFKEAVDKQNRILRKLIETEGRSVIYTQKWRDAMRSAKKEIREAQVFSRNYGKELEKLIKTQKTFTQEIQHAHNLLGRAMGVITGFTTALGGQAIGFRSILDATKKYNAGVFTLSRFQAIAGRSFGNYNKAIESATSNTVLSKNAFLDLAASLNQSYVGIRPNMDAMSDYAQLLQSRVGPNLEMIQKQNQELIQIQKQYPPIFNELTGAELKSLVKRAEAGDKFAKKELDNQKALMMIRMEGLGFSQEQTDAALKMMTPLSGEERKMMELGQAYENTAKEAENAMINMGKSVEGALIKATEVAQNFYNLLSKFPTVAATVIAAFGGIGTALQLKGAFGGGRMLSGGLTAMGGGSGALGKMGRMGQFLPVGRMGARMGLAGLGTGLLGGGLAAAGIYGAYQIGKAGVQYGRAKIGEREQRNNVEEILNSPKLKGVLGEGGYKKFKGRGGLNEDKSLEERYKIYRQVVKEVRQEKLKIVGATDKEKNTVVEIQQKYRDVITTQKARVKLAEDTMRLLQSEAQLIKDMGGMASESLLKGIAGVATSGLQAAKAALPATMEAAAGGPVADIFKKYGGKLTVGGGTDQEKAVSAVKQLNEFLTKNKLEQKETDIITSSIKKIEDARLLVSQKENEVYQSTGNLAKRNYDLVKSTGAAFESRLNTERQLMELTQFGLGASVEMMQKQVDLAQQNIVSFEGARKKLREIRMEEGKANEEIMDRIESSKTIQEAEAYILEKTEGNADQYKALINYAKEYQEITEGTMKEKVKILELTKNIREGYLDAIRSMAIGAGEFTKIIGNQERGTSQLFKTIKKATGEVRGTMGAGGLVNTKASTAAQLMGFEARKSIAGAYDAAEGAWFYTGEAPLANITGETQRDLQKSLVGTAVAGGEENYRGAAVRASQLGTGAVLPAVLKGHFPKDTPPSGNQATVNFATAAAESMRTTNEIMEYREAREKEIIDDKINTEKQANSEIAADKQQKEITATKNVLGVGGGGGSGSLSALTGGLGGGIKTFLGSSTGIKSFMGSKGSIKSFIGSSDIKRMATDSLTAPSKQGKWSFKRDDTGRMMKQWSPVGSQEATVTIYLSPELKGQIDQNSGVIKRLAKV